MAKSQLSLKSRIGSNVFTKKFLCATNDFSYNEMPPRNPPLLLSTFQ
ncbi:hypothetical protein B4065_2190 [Caldibacillus thermoamylovorans]|nr:hypothetical protein B4065_2190 [Caldibacillus thermoamylovorans]